MLFNRNVIIEKYSSVYKLLYLQQEIDFYKNEYEYEDEDECYKCEYEDDLMLKQLDEYFNILHEHLEFDKKEERCSNFKENIDYLLDYDKNYSGGVPLLTASIDGDDWNSLCLYTEFALYKLTKKNPIHIFEFERYGEYNKIQFELFLKGKGEFKIRI